MKLLGLLPTWAVALFTIAMSLSFIIAFGGVQGFGRDPLVGVIAVVWSVLGCAELLRRMGDDPPPKTGSGGPPPYWP